MFKYPIWIYFSFIILLLACHTVTENTDTKWPETNYISRPWTRWWWQGSAVTREGITSELESLQKAGFGGVEITPIYGVAGYEKEFIPYLSDKWIEMLQHTLNEAKRLGLGVDMATGTGWPFGGPWVNDQTSCKYFVYRKYKVVGGSGLGIPIRYEQEPFVRAVGNQIYELHGIYKLEDESPQGTIKNPLLNKSKRAITIDQLKDPVSSNEDLQWLALDQVRFKKDLPIAALMAYSENGEILNLIDSLRGSILAWKAPEGEWTIYAIFQGDHGKMVERAAPGGEGNVIDHFSEEAIDNYLKKFDSVFVDFNPEYLRAFFNDSYEVDDARGSSDWTPDFFNEFQKRRGYDLRDHLPILLGDDTIRLSVRKRLLCDYRETLSDLIYENFTQSWKSWAHGHNALIRNQAHGSPANILDLYALSDIPETEGTEPLRIKMASSAAHISGKQLTSSESATWLNEHFLSNLSGIKKVVDNYFVNGVNHIVYHGTSYSPDKEKWPGWLFYAAVHVNDRNPFWQDLPALNDYISRSQSFLQLGYTLNDILLYYPIYDRFSTPGNEMIEHFSGAGDQFEGMDFKLAADQLLTNGYSFDFISDRQVQQLSVQEDKILTGKSQYKTLIIPHCGYMPIATFQKIMDLANDGAKVIFFNGLPEHTSGFAGHKQNDEKFDQVKAELNFQFAGDLEIKSIGNGNVYAGQDLNQLLAETGIEGEPMTKAGLKFIRKKIGNEIVYFVNNPSSEKYIGWIPLLEGTDDVLIFDPMNGKSGKSEVREGNEKMVYLELLPQQSLILKCFNKRVELTDFDFFAPETSEQLEGKWDLTFTSHDPGQQISLTIDSLSSWTNLDNQVLKSFSGTGTYSISFQKPDITSEWLRLDLGEVKESAGVRLNGKHLGTLIGPVFLIDFSSDMLVDDENLLEIEVTNLMANKIADMDKKGVVWKKFYNINFPARLSENRDPNGLFTAKNWPPKESGLLGPVRLISLEKLDFDQSE